MNGVIVVLGRQGQAESGQIFFLLISYPMSTPPHLWALKHLVLEALSELTENLEVGHLCQVVHSGW